MSQTQGRGGLSGANRVGCFDRGAVLNSLVGGSLVYDGGAYSRSPIAGKKPLFLYENHLKKN